jgi:sialidase-1
MFSVPALAVSIYTQDLFRQLDSRLPAGDYRIPSLVATTNGTLLAFVNGRMHRTDHTPDIIYMRRSHTDGNTWEEARAILDDPSNRTEFSGAPVVDPATGDVIMLFQRTGARSL